MLLGKSLEAFKPTALAPSMSLLLQGRICDRVRLTAVFQKITYNFGLLDNRYRGESLLEPEVTMPVALKKPTNQTKTGEAATNVATPIALCVTSP